MTENLKEAFLKAFKNEDGLCNPVYFYGKNASTVVTTMELGLHLLHEREPIWRTNGFQIASYSYFHVDRAIDHFKECPDKRGLFVVSSLEMLFGEKTVLFDKDARELFYKILDIVHENGGQVLLGAACPPEELAGMDEDVRERILGGLVCREDDGEELGGPIDELTALGLLPAREKGRYAALYEERFLDLFPAALTETLSEEQLEALGQMNELARSVTMRRNVSIVDREYRKLNELFSADKWDSDMLAFEICYEVHQKALDIQAGRKIDPTFYSVIYGAAEDDDWTDPKVWKKANPSLGITVGIDKVKAACLSAQQNPGEENAFRQLRLNQWVKQSVRWMPMDKWDACAFPVSEDDLEGRVCYGGLDLSSTTDITAFVLVFPPSSEDDRYTILPYFWIPEENLELRVRRDHVPYEIWRRQGYLMTTEGNVVHYGYIEKFIEKLGERFNIREIAFDRWGAVQMVQNLEGMGFTVVPFGQGFKDMSPPTKELMKLVLEKRIAHDGHPVLRWMMDNIFIRSDPAGNIKPDKEKSTEKIDGAVATVMALDRAIRCGNDTAESVYDSRGLLFI